MARNGRFAYNARISRRFFFFLNNILKTRHLRERDYRWCNRISALYTIILYWEISNRSWILHGDIVGKKDLIVRLNSFFCYSRWIKWVKFNQESLARVQYKDLHATHRWSINHECIITSLLLLLWLIVILYLLKWFSGILFIFDQVDIIGRGGCWRGRGWRDVFIYFILLWDFLFIERIIGMSFRWPVCN